MNATERKQKSRAAEKLGLVAAPRGYVTPYMHRVMATNIKIRDDQIVDYIKVANQR